MSTLAVVCLTIVSTLTVQFIMLVILLVLCLEPGDLSMDPYRGWR